MAETTTEAATTQTETATSSQTASTTETQEQTSLLDLAETTQEQAASEQTQSESGETKTEATKTDETKTETKVEGAPEKYEFAEADKYDPKMLGLFSDAAKEANLTQGAAQIVLEKMSTALQAQTAEQVQSIHQQWTEASKADKEFGGEHLAENLGTVKRALDAYATPELVTFLKTSGLGNHPEVLRLLYRAGKSVSEDTVVTGGSNPRAAKPEEVFYPTMVEKK